jgi:ribosome-associated protein
MIPITTSLVIPDEELEWTYARSGGPGGQNVNKVASKSVLRWKMADSLIISPAIKDRIRAARPSLVTGDGDLLIVSQRYRDQDRNRQDCIEKLTTVIQSALLPPKPRRPTKPTRGSRERRLQDKKKQADRKANRRHRPDE